MTTQGESGKEILALVFTFSLHHFLLLFLYCLTFSNCIWVTLGAQEGKLGARQQNCIGRLDIRGVFVWSGRRRTVRHADKFSMSNRNKQQIGGIKCQRGHWPLRWLMKKITDP